MDKEDFEQRKTISKRSQKPSADPSNNKAFRVMLLAMLLQMAGKERLTREEIYEQVSQYGQNPQKALYRDLQTLSGELVESLPDPGDEHLDEWCAEQQRQGKLAITYDRHAGTFGLVQSAFKLDLNEDEARAFVALQGSFIPGTPYADAVQRLLQRWEWLFSEKSRRLVNQKRRRLAHPVLLPLSPAVDYAQHTNVILQLDAALETGAYISFAYTPLQRNWDDEPIFHRHVEPYELEYRDGHWYFTAFVFKMNKFIDYRVDRIHPASVQMEHDHFYPGGRKRPGIKIRYWVAPEMARHNTLSTRLWEQKVTLLDGGQGAIVEGYARSIWWAMRLLLGYGEQVKALEPEELVQRMRETAQGMGRLYMNGGRDMT
jgi:predicted DNA-binding transcriptional regulator YafY